MCPDELGQVLRSNGQNNSYKSEFLDSLRTLINICPSSESMLGNAWSFYT